MKNPERMSYAVPDPDKFVGKPWRARRHIRTQVERHNEVLGIQIVSFVTQQQRDAFLVAEKNIVPLSICRRGASRQGAFGSHKGRRGNDR